MIVDITGTILTPGNNGDNCMGDGTHHGIECCCEECDYMLCCLGERFPSECPRCEDRDCPHCPLCNESNRAFSD